MKPAASTRSDVTCPVGVDAEGIIMDTADGYMALDPARANALHQDMGEDAMADEQYDAIVIRTSKGGRFLPVELAKAGQKVALVERDQLGGVCVNTGCTPTKTMVASARLAYQARRGAEYGVRIGPVSVDLAAVRERKRAMVARGRQNYASRLAQDGLDLIEAKRISRGRTPSRSP